MGSQFSDVNIYTYTITHWIEDVERLTRACPGLLAYTSILAPPGAPRIHSNNEFRAYCNIEMRRLSRNCRIADRTVRHPRIERISSSLLLAIV